MGSIKEKTVRMLSATEGGLLEEDLYIRFLIVKKKTDGSFKTMH